MRTGAAQIGDSLAPAAPHTIVLVALDGVRWQEVFRGVDPALARAHGLSDAETFEARELVPNLHAVASAGVAVGSGGRGMTAGGPSYVSLPGYFEMFTGGWPTSCFDNLCRHVSVSTVVDQFASELGTSALDVAVVTSWEQIERAAASAPNRATISTGRTGGLTRDRLRFDDVSTELLRRGEHAGPGPGIADFRRDSVTADLALHYLRSRRPRFLFIGLGETDEYAHRNDYRGYLNALIDADQVIGDVAATLVEYGHEGRRATLIVTTDHGRDRDFAGHGQRPESGAVWMVAAGSGIQRRGSFVPSRPLRLADVGGIVRTLGDPRGGVRPHDSVAEVVAPNGGHASFPRSVKTNHRVAAKR